MVVILSFVACSGPTVEEAPPVLPDVAHAEVAWVFEKPPISADLVDMDEAYDLSCMARADDQILWFSGGAVWAVNAATGALNWSNAFSPSPSLCYDTPAVDSERIYIEQYESVVALNLADGSLAWVSEELPIERDWSYCHGRYSGDELEILESAGVPRPLSLGGGVLAMPSGTWGRYGLGVYLLDAVAGGALLHTDEVRAWGAELLRGVVPPLRQGWFVQHDRTLAPVHLSFNGEYWTLREDWEVRYPNVAYSDGDTRMDLIQLLGGRYVRGGLEMDPNSHRSLAVVASLPPVPPEPTQNDDDLYYWNTPWGYGPDFVVGLVPSKTELIDWDRVSADPVTLFSPALVRYTGLSPSPDWVFREAGFVSVSEAQNHHAGGPTVPLPVVDGQVFFVLSNLQQVSEEGILEALQIDGQAPNSVLVVVDTTTGELAWLGLTEEGVPGVVYGDLENSLHCPPVVTDEHVIVSEPHRITAFRRLR